MTSPNFAPGTSEADVFTIDTQAGRARQFNKRIDELMRTKGCKNLDEAVFALRTSEDPNVSPCLQRWAKPQAFTARKN